MSLNFSGILSILNDKVSTENYGDNPPELYEPIKYIMNLGGKRLRPLLALSGYHLYKDDFEKIIRPALAIEVFHNFTLMHDDIMDQAPLRRGKPTVHEKWNPNIAILSGDVMLIKAYDLLLDVESSKFKTVVEKFNKCAAEVCEGQQLDMNYQESSSVNEEQYLEMIRLKTAVLLGFSLEMGALLAGASSADLALIKSFGQNIGVGFQLKDDLLDVYADNEKFGKQVGGDILVNKKTFLLIKSLELAGKNEREKLWNWINSTSFDPQKKVKEVTEIFNQLGIKEIAQNKMNEFFEKGFSDLEKLNCNEERKLSLRKFAETLIERDH